MDDRPRKEAAVRTASPVERERQRFRPGNAGALIVTAGLAGASIALATATWNTTGADIARLKIPWPVLLAMFAVTETFVLHVQIGRQAKTISLSEIPLVLALFYASTPVLLLTRLAGSMAVFVLHRRQRSPIKLAFNAALVAADALAAVALFHLVDDLLSGNDHAPWVATYVALAAFGLLSAVALAIVIGCYDGLRVGEVAHDAASAALMSVAVGTLGLVGVVSLAEDTTTGWLLAASAVVLLLGYRAYSRLSDRHLSLERLYRFSQVVGTMPEMDEVLRSVLEEARQLLRAEHAEITFLTEGDEHAAIRVSLDPYGDLERTDVEPADGAGVDAAVVASGAPTLVTRRTRDRAMRAYLERRGQREAIVVPLRNVNGVTGTMSVANRLGDVRSFDESDVRLLETVANHAAVALQNGRLIGQLRHDSLHDALTGLPNRVLLMSRMREALGRMRAGASVGVATLLMDLDRFKEVNDTLGHHHGDQLLIEVARRLQGAAGGSATVARLGGDEFAVLLPDVGDGRSASEAARRLLDALEQPFTLNDLELDVSGSIGIAVAPHHATDASGLLKRADVAMYAAKTSHTGLRLYESTLDHHAPERLALLAELRQAVQLDQLSIHVQPKADVATRSVTTVEALVRWPHPQHGMVPPSEFVPMAERSGLIIPLTMRVLRAALEACSTWRAQGRDIGVAVNLSARALLDHELPDDVADLLEEYRVPAGLLTLEITESSVMTDPERTIAVLSKLRRMGVRLSVDDFGTGYSSLSYLQRLPVHEVKIDRSFVTDLCTNADDAAIVRSIIDLGDNLSLGVVAEGVEDDETWRRLADMGCGAAQGYHLTRPLPVDDLLPWLAVHEASLSVSR